MAAESAELLGVDPPSSPAEPLTLSGRPALPSCGITASAGTRTSRCSAGCACAAALLGLQDADLAALPAVRGLTPARSPAIGWRFGEPARAAVVRCAAMLIALAGIDWDTTFPRQPHAAAAVGGHRRRGLGWTLPLPEAIWGAVAGYLSLWSVYWLFKLTTGKEGMGFGDFKLLAALGAWLGWQMILPIVLMAPR